MDVFSWICLVKAVFSFHFCSHRNLLDVDTFSKSDPGRCTVLIFPACSLVMLYWFEKTFLKNFFITSSSPNIIQHMWVVGAFSSSRLLGVYNSTRPNTYEQSSESHYFPPSRDTHNFEVMQLVLPQYQFSFS